MKQIIICLILYLLFVVTSAITTSNNEKITTSMKEEHDYISAVDDILFVEEFSGLGRIVGTCQISVNNQLRYRAKISEMACTHACEGGKDPRRYCHWNSKIIREGPKTHTTSQTTIGLCMIKGGDDTVRYESRISKVKCQSACNAGRDHYRICLFDNTIIRQRPVHIVKQLCAIYGSDDSLRYSAKISKDSCSKSCSAGKDHYRICKWGSIVLRARPMKRIATGSCVIISGQRKVKFKKKRYQEVLVNNFANAGRMSIENASGKIL